MLVKWNPVTDLFRNEPVFGDLFRTTWPTMSERTVFQPNVELRETDQAYLIDVELPGLDRNDFNLKLENDLLILEGERKYEHEENRAGFYRSERSYGTFLRTFRLTDEIDRNNIQAEYTNGVLHITLPKVETAHAKQIEVKVR